MKKPYLTNITKLCVVALATVQLFSAFSYVQAEETFEAPETFTTGATTTGTSYFQYFKSVEDAPRPTTPIRIDGCSAEGAADSFTEAGQTGIRLDANTGAKEWRFFVQESGVYSLYATAYALGIDDTELLLSLMLDGQRPYDEAGSLLLPRLWRDHLSEEGVFPTDASGSERRPLQESVQRWYTATFTDTQGLYDEPYLFYLEQGEHRLSLSSEQSVAIAELTFCNTRQAPTYEEYRSSIQGSGKAAEVVRQESEYTLEKNSQMLYPGSDRTDPATLPNDPYLVRLNTIGQSNWSKMGEAITWSVQVPTAGWYTLHFRARQDINPDAASYRKLLINGEIPFREAERVEFTYSDSWKVTALGGDKPLAVYLQPGDTLTLECAGGSGAITRNIYEAVLEANTVYRKIIVITGASPDIYRDYRLETQIPDLMDSLKRIRLLMQNTDQQLSAQGRGGPVLSTIREMASYLNEVIDLPYTIPERLSVFKTNIESLGSYLLTIGSHPLELDCFYYVPEGQALPKTEATIWQHIWFQLKKFTASFTNDYNAYANDDGAAQQISVWVSTGRDQAQLLSSMIDDTFTPKTDIAVKLSLVDTSSTLIQATLAGKGPDAALMIISATPINLAMRGALVDLSKPQYGLDAIYDDYFSETWTPYRFNNGIYAIPETQTFDVMFYRTDILQELGLTPPETWDEFYEAVKVIHKNNLGVGMLEVNSANLGVTASMGVFDRFLLQRGGTYYNEKLSATAFDSPEAYAAFEEWVSLYKTVGLDREFDFFNRFRSGEMPLGISAYSTYNQLVTAAPEIRGLWDFALVPGTPVGGTVSHAESSTGTACMMLKAAEEKGRSEETMTFLTWWTSAETQTQYGLELEAMMGVASRYTPAHPEAFKNMNWTDTQRRVLLEQWEQVINMPEIPGNYMISRYLTNALRSGITSSGPISRRLDIYNTLINDEITRKRKEFNLE